MKVIFITFILTVLFTSVFGFLWVSIHLWARYRLGERSSKACAIAGNSSEHCCQYVESCPEEIRSKCKHAILKP